MGAFLLTSAGFENPRIGEEFLRLAAKPAAEIRVLMIPTAAITEEQRFYVGKSREELLNVGIREDNLMQVPIGEPVYYASMEGFDTLYVCGGDTPHLLKEIVKAGFDKKIRCFLDEGGVYVGVSAGSIVAGPRVVDQEGLMLVNAIIVPHYSDDDTERRARVEKYRTTTTYPVVPLTDRQALRVIGEQSEIIE